MEVGKKTDDRYFFAKGFLVSFRKKYKEFIYTLDFGKIKAKFAGSSAGHNWVK